MDFNFFPHEKSFGKVLLYLGLGHVGEIVVY